MPFSLKPVLVHLAQQVDDVILAERQLPEMTNKTSSRFNMHDYLSSVTIISKKKTFLINPNVTG